ncbi:MAG TPA: GDP-mannose 4,6-dehydratase [Burkholderiaceae bacterium]|nr:GDP-mannose 4,6-dehydratase [Burkholderiaceae bacterium]
MDSPTEAPAKPVVLVTGARGFTGRHLKRELLAHGYSVVGTIIEGAPDVDEVVMDLGDPASVRAVVQRTQPDYVVHLAAISHVQHQPELDFYRVNVLGTLHLVDALAELPRPPRKTLIASSANVYGNSTRSPLDEDALPAPVNHYAVSKLAMEHLVRTRFERLPIIVTRPFNYTGVGQGEQFVVPKIVAHFRRRASVVELGNLDVARDFSDVRSVVGAYRRLLESTAVSEVLNLASGIGTSLRDVIDHLTVLAAHEIEVRVNPAFVRASEVRTLVGDASRLQARIGAVQAIPLVETLRWMLSQPD